jgi:hypothetical protein
VKVAWEFSGDRGGRRGRGEFLAGPLIFKAWVHYLFANGGRVLGRMATNGKKNLDEFRWSGNLLFI